MVWERCNAQYLNYTHTSNVENLPSVCVWEMAQLVIVHASIDAVPQCLTRVVLFRGAVWGGGGGGTPRRRPCA